MRLMSLQSQVRCFAQRTSIVRKSKNRQYLSIVLSIVVQVLKAGVGHSMILWTVLGENKPQEPALLRIGTNKEHTFDAMQSKL